MALTESINKEYFITPYETYWNKVSVAKATIANYRYEPQIQEMGDTVKRVRAYFEGLAVQDVNDDPSVALTYGEMEDTKETMTVNKDRDIRFYLRDKQIKQAGSLKPDEAFGLQAGRFMTRDFDAQLFAEVRNALYNFDNGDLTTRTSSGTPLTLNATTVPQLIGQFRAKLSDDPMNQELNNLILVVDPYHASQIDQYMLGKNIDLSGVTFKNGSAGEMVGGAQLYVSSNLSADSTIDVDTNPTLNQTFTINGLTYTFVDTIGTTPGNVLRHVTTASTSFTNLKNALNQSGGTVGTDWVAWTNVAPNFYLNTWRRLGITASHASNVLTLSTIGSGALKIGGTAIDGVNNVISTNFVNAYAGKPKTLDVAIQSLENLNPEKLRDKDAYGYYFRMRKYWAQKLFRDMSHQCLRVKINS